MIGMILELHKYIVKKWISLRLAAQEFYFKQPFEIKDEYPIMKSILFFALAPMELIFIFRNTTDICDNQFSCIQSINQPYQRKTIY